MLLDYPYMTGFLHIIQLSSAVLLAISILLQHRGTGIGGAFGGADMSYRSRRGIEKLLFRATILFGAVFITSIVVRLFI